MINRFYVTSVIEDWISERYNGFQIHYPQDIDIHKIAYFYRIYIHYRPMPARYDMFGQFKAIVVDSRSSPLEQKEQFFHELCHILRHVGHQSMMPKAFRELQEWDANLFMMYAALPYYLVKQYDFESPHLIDDLAHDFRVTKDLCKKRIEHIHRNCTYHQTLMNAEFA